MRARRRCTPVTDISEDDYVARALPELTALLEAIDAIDDNVEAELESDILTLEFADDSRYVINSHRAARQIWMAAERSAWHFDWNAARAAWIAEKTGDELWQTLTKLLSDKVGRTVTLSRNGD
jgi:CyaY protein